MGRILDAIFGKRYVRGWPRGVKPMVPGLLQIKADNPQLWGEIANDPAYIGITKLREKGLL